MLTLFHAPMSRSTRIVTLLEELGAREAVQVKTVSVQRRDGGGGPDPENPHPEKKVPVLEHDGTIITESIAIAIHLCTLFPDAELMPAAGTPEHGKALQWLAWNAGVVEPVLIAKLTDDDNPAFQSAFRGWDEVMLRLKTALDTSPWLLGSKFSVADLIVHSSFSWMPDLLPDHAVIQDWNSRMMARPAVQKTFAEDQEAMAVLAGA
ncbi:glutathione S-transferase family protein [Tropicibacter sp. R15_0]|uniref:glutathione S-transferase family protein n=1 Tax=Tropicibacter sp. R15_0 TaxID=2821101 RepID=UPI001AD9F930|nr:glutathione S-transferase family protein [Tropicibacter sp. R15_0]MBO9466351.1 glutathione S-transferase family protein [Tropicibacter sp. R15_0]